MKTMFYYIQLNKLHTSKFLFINETKITYIRWTEKKEKWTKQKTWKKWTFWQMKDFPFVLHIYKWNEWIIEIINICRNKKNFCHKIYNQNDKKQKKQD